MEMVFNSLANSVDGIGRRVQRIFSYTAHLTQLNYLAIRAALFEQPQGLRTILNVVCSQIYFTGVQALPLISMISLATGALVVLESSAQLSIFGNMDFVGNLMVMIVVRELGPLITALVVIARSGTAVASELGNMRANSEMDALESMGIDPLSYVVFPRLAGGVISLLCLAFYFDVMALVGGFIVSFFVHNMSVSTYTDVVAQALGFQDVFIFLIKNGLSGLIIFTVACYQGFQVQQGPQEVPQVTTKAVVNSIMYVIAFHVAVSAFFFIKRLLAMGVL